MNRRRAHPVNLAMRWSGYGEHFDIDGNPISQEEWAAQFAGPRWQLVNEHGEVRVSTVFIGLNHQFDADKPPLIFETMVFIDGDDVDCWRYTSKSEAEEGHDILWRKYRKKREWTVSDRITPIG